MFKVLDKSHSHVPDMFVQYIKYLRQKKYTATEITKAFEDKGISIDYIYVRHILYYKKKHEFKVNYVFRKNIGQAYLDSIFACSLRGKFLNIYIQFMSNFDIKAPNEASYIIYDFRATSVG